MVLSTFSNSETYSSASISITCNMEQRKITVEVVVNDVFNQTCDSVEFAAEDFGKAIDLYEEAVKRFESQKRDDQKIREAVDAYIAFEQDTSEIYPFAVEDPTEDQRQKITEICLSINTEDVYEACEKVLGINEVLKGG